MLYDMFSDTEPLFWYLPWVVYRYIMALSQSLKSERTDTVLEENVCFSYHKNYKNNGQCTSSVPMLHCTAAFLAAFMLIS